MLLVGADIMHAIVLIAILLVAWPVSMTLISTRDKTRGSRPTLPT
jgi:hypothetical protein